MLGAGKLKEQNLFFVNKTIKDTSPNNSNYIHFKSLLLSTEYLIYNSVLKKKVPLGEYHYLHVVDIKTEA